MSPFTVERLLISVPSGTLSRGVVFRTFIPTISKNISSFIVSPGRNMLHVHFLVSPKATRRFVFAASERKSNSYVSGGRSFPVHPVESTQQREKKSVPPVTVDFVWRKLIVILLATVELFYRPLANSGPVVRNHLIYAAILQGSYRASLRTWTHGTFTSGKRNNHGHLPVCRKVLCNFHLFHRVSRCKLAVVRHTCLSRATELNPEGS